MSKYIRKKLKNNHLKCKIGIGTFVYSMKKCMLILRFNKITFNRLFNQSLWSLKDKLEVSIR